MTGFSPLVDLRGDPDEPALVVAGGAASSRAEVADQVEAVAAALVERGIGPGDPVGLVGANGPALAVGFLAVSSVAAVAPLNPVLPGPELAFELADLRLRGVVVVGGPAPPGSPGWPTPVVAAAEAAAIPVWRLEPRPGDRPGAVELVGPDLGRAGGRAADIPGVDPAIGLLLHTSGTTARPKTVPLTRANLVASAAAVAASLELAPDDVGIEVMPLFHVHGLVAGLLAPLHAGSAVICTPGFHAPDLAGWFRGTRPTWLTAVPTMLLGLVERLAAHPGERPERPLRLLRSSSAPLAPALQAEAERLLAPVVEAYGMTEAAHQIASNGRRDHDRRAGTVGRPAGAEVRIRLDAGDGDGDGGPPGGWAEPGQIGEVVIRGPGVTAGYVDPDGTVNPAAFVDGWLRTGDQGRLDPDGFLTLTGRLKELINRGGEKISPREIDEVLVDHPAVSQAVTFAVADPRLGEAVAAAVVAAPDATPVERDLRQFVARRLAVHKVPRRVVVVDHLPEGPSGKLTRLGLAARFGLDHPDGLEATVSDGPEGRSSDGRSTGLTTVGPPASPEVVAFVAARWAEVLGLGEPPDGDQHFLDLGGDSMAAARLLADLTDQLDLAISMLDLFDRPTVEGQARLIEELLRAEPGR